MKAHITEEMVTKLGDALGPNSPWTPAERTVIKWRAGMYGSFYSVLWEAITRADSLNLEKLGEGFPLEVYGYIQWKKGDLATRLWAAGLDI